MLPRKLSESLTARVFLITLLILLSAGAVTFGLIAWATPSTYTAVVTDDLTVQVDQLVDQLDGTEEQSCGPLLDQFIRTSGAEAMLVGPDGRIADTGSQLAVQSVYEDSSLVITSVQGDSTVTYDAGTSHTDDTVAVTMSEQATITAEVRFVGQEDSYTLYVTPRMEAENLAVRALAQMAPWILLVLLVFSLLCALVYSRYITRPIVRLSGIAGKMAQLDFQWESSEKRGDEIGRLGRSLDQMARKLSAALTDLEGANRALRGEVERERELDRQRMAFFNAASHELKTPVTILKGHLRYAGGCGHLPGSGQVPASLSSGNRTDGKSGAGDAGYLPYGEWICGCETGAGGSVRPHGAPAGPGYASFGTKRSASGKRPDTGNRCHWGRLVAGADGRQSAFQCIPLLPGWSGGTSLVRPSGWPTDPDGGEHRGSDQ